MNSWIQGALSSTVSEFTQSLAHRVGDAIYAPHPLLPPSTFALDLSQHQGLFQWVGALHQVAKILELRHQSFKWLFRVDFLWDWLVWYPCSPQDSQESSSAPQFESINSSVLSFLYGPTLTSVHDYWEYHSFDFVSQSDVSTFQYAVWICHSFPSKEQRESFSVVSDSVTQYSPWNSPGKNTGVGSLSLLQGIYPTQGSNWGLLHCRQILYQPSYQGSPSKEQASFNFVAADTIHRDFGAKEKKICHCFPFPPFYFPWSDGIRCCDLSFLNVEFQASFFNLLFHP